MVWQDANVTSINQAVIRLLQLSDIHLFGKTSGELLHVNTEVSFQAVLQLLKTKMDDFDFAILSGDLTQDGSDQSYQKIVQFLNKFTFPIYAIPGNHDDPTIMQQSLENSPISTQQHLISQHWQFILLHSFKRGTPRGELPEKELNMMQHYLETCKHHAAIILHHPPISVKSEWLDTSQLINSVQFWEIISKFNHVKTVICGHVHQAFEKKIGNVMLYAAPSTCIQFKPGETNFALDPIPPGYRWLHFYKDGHIKTGIERAPHYVGEFDKTAKGY